LRKIFRKKICNYAGINEEKLNEADAFYENRSLKEVNEQGE
jgi:hypothetical protein